jgi:hypothetical protein
VLGPFRHGVPVLRWFLDGTRVRRLAADNHIGTTTRDDQLREAAEHDRPLPGSYAKWHRTTRKGSPMASSGALATPDTSAESRKRVSTGDSTPMFKTAKPHGCRLA